MKKTILFLFFCILSLAASAQDVRIELTPFTLEVPKVVALVVRPMGSLVEKRDTTDSTKFVYSQNIYYELIREDGRTAETGNVEIPEQFADLLRKYKKRGATLTDMQIINAYLAGFNARMKAVKPQ